MAWLGHGAQGRVRLLDHQAVRYDLSSGAFHALGPPAGLEVRVTGRPPGVLPDAAAFHLEPVEQLVDEAHLTGASGEVVAQS